MILDYIDDNLDGDSWEKLCDSCYRMRYQKEHYQKVPAILGGDGGIEGFTKTGIVYQCYCPERKYTDEELYEHLRDKMTRDIAKLIDLKYAKKLKDLGLYDIKEWHFVIPQYKDHRILVHAENKRKEVIKLINNDPINYDYIKDSFIIVVKEAEDFKIELTRIIRNSLTDIKLEFAIKNIDPIDWTKCDTEKVNNIKRKVKAVSDLSEDDDEFKYVVNIYVEAYIKGIEILNVLRVNFVEIYDDLYELEQSYKREVSLKTMMNTDSSMNYKLFSNIMDDFERKLKEEFSNCISQATIFELKTDLISGWLADCSMQFKRG
jgi:hypothetical protein